MISAKMASSSLDTLPLRRAISIVSRMIIRTAANMLITLLDRKAISTCGLHQPLTHALIAKDVPMKCSTCRHLERAYKVGEYVEARSLGVVQCLFGCCGKQEC